MQALEWLDRAVLAGFEPAKRLRDDLVGVNATSVLRRGSNLRHESSPYRQAILILIGVFAVWAFLAIGNKSMWPWKWTGHKF